MSRRKRTITLAIVFLGVVAGFIGINRYVVTADARSLFSERFDAAKAHLDSEGTEVLDWDLVRSAQGQGEMPGELAALEGEEVTVIGFVTPHDTGLLRIYGGRHSNYENPLTYAHVVELDLSPLPKTASFFGSVRDNERIRVRITDPRGTTVHAEYPQLYSGFLVLDPDAEHGVVVQLHDAEHLTAASD